MSGFELEGRSALVTGAAMGIGRGIAQALGGAGANVLMVDKAAAELDRAVKEVRDAVQGGVEQLVVDVTESDAAGRATAACRAAFGGIDILVNNAGAYPLVPLADVTPELFDQLLSLNVRAALLMAQAAAAAMVEAGRGGSIINIGSLDAFRPTIAGLALYGGSKAALIAMTKHMAAELGPGGIRVNALVPGGIATEGAARMSEAGGSMTEEERQAMLAGLAARIPLRRIGTPADMAGPAVFLASEASGYVTGSILVVDGGMLVAT